MIKILAVVLMCIASNVVLKITKVRNCVEYLELNRKVLTKKYLWLTMDKKDKIHPQFWILLDVEWNP